MRCHACCESSTGVPTGGAHAASINARATRLKAGKRATRRPAVSSCRAGPGILLRNTAVGRSGRRRSPPPVMLRGRSESPVLRPRRATCPRRETSEDRRRPPSRRTPGTSWCQLWCQCDGAGCTREGFERSRLRVRVMFHAGCGIEGIPECGPGLPRATRPATGEGPIKFVAPPAPDRREVSLMAGS